MKLTVTKTSDWEGKATGAKPELGTKITYTITVKNDGNVPYTNVNFTDLLQNGDASVTGEIPTYGTLPVNEEKSFTVEYIVTEADLLKESSTTRLPRKPTKSSTPIMKVKPRRPARPRRRARLR